MVANIEVTPIRRILIVVGYGDVCTALRCTMAKLMASGASNSPANVMRRCRDHAASTTGRCSRYKIVLCSDSSILLTALTTTTPILATPGGPITILPVFGTAGSGSPFLLTM